MIKSNFTQGWDTQTAIKARRIAVSALLLILAYSFAITGVFALLFSQFFASLPPLPGMRPIPVEGSLFALIGDGFTVISNVLFSIAYFWARREAR